MNIVQITPGAGGMFCGNCFRDNALVAEFRRLGHPALMIPLYLPLTLEEPDQSRGTPTFFSGINVYLEQKLPWFKRAPEWLHRWLASPALLRWAAGRAAKTRPADVGDLTLSMLRGEEGNQARELDELIGWLRGQNRPDVICLSNAMLIGLARRLRSETGAAVICMLQGEDSFLDALPEPARADSWRTLRERAVDANLFIAPSHYYGERLRERLALGPNRVRVVYNGINLEGYQPSASAQDDHGQPVLGYFARMCREKGLDTLIEAYCILRRRNRVKNLRLKVGGGCGPSDARFVESLRDRLRSEGVLGETEFHPNLDRAAKLAFLSSLTIFSVPALYGEAFGLYLIEAWASGVPVVQPRHAAFPELIEATGGGVICEPGNPSALAEAIESLLLDSDRRRSMADRGLKAAREQFSIERLARETLTAFEEAKRVGRLSE